MVSTHRIQTNTEYLILIHLSSVIKLVEGLVHIFGAEVGGMQFILSNPYPLNGHGVFVVKMLCNVIEHFLQSIKLIRAHRSLKQKRLIMPRIDGDEIKSDGVVLGFEVEQQIIRRHAQLTGNGFLQPGYLNMLIGSGHDHRSEVLT